MEVMEVLMLSPVTKRSRVQTPDECHQPPATAQAENVDSCVEGDRVYTEQ